MMRSFLIFVLLCFAPDVAAFTTYNGLVQIHHELEKAIKSNNKYLANRLRDNIRHRVQWRHDNQDDMYIIVNVAAQELQVIQHDNTVMHKRVVVGRAGMETPTFTDEITSIVFNPTWNIPPDIADGMLPSIKADGGWPGYKIYVDGVLVDDINDVAVGSDYRLIQDPGAKNALGEIKFNMPNKYGVYIHDTPRKDLFNLQQRAYSAGCIRLDDANELAAFLLSSDIEAIDSIADEGVTMEIPLSQSVPVYIVDWDVFIDINGKIQYR